MKTYYISDANGKIKQNWEEINCSGVKYDGDIVEFYNQSFIPIVIYRLAPGEAIVFSYED